jgi:hypothetical protein
LGSNSRSEGREASPRGGGAPILTAAAYACDYCELLCLFGNGVKLLNLTYLDEQGILLFTRFECLSLEREKAEKERPALRLDRKLEARNVCANQ